MLIALKLAGLLIYKGVTLSGLGIFLSPTAYVFYFGLVLVLMLRKLHIPGAVLISIILASLLAHTFGLGDVGEPVILSKDMFDAILGLDFGVIANPRILSVILVVCV